MTRFERMYTIAETFLPPLHRRVRRELGRLLARRDPVPRLLDVGGRKSHYTIGVPARVTVTDLPRASDLQRELNLGLTDRMRSDLKRRRSNVEAVVIDDMTESRLPDESFDCAVAVEVLEHVELDDRFLENVRRVLKPGGVFLMTTPNGDFVRNTNPDHKRHYTRRQLVDALSRHFAEVRVEYAVRGGLFRRLGLASWSTRHPLRTLLGMAGNVVNGLQSSSPALASRSSGTHHLVATAVRRS